MKVKQRKREWRNPCLLGLFKVITSLFNKLTNYMERSPVENIIVAELIKKFFTVH
jgi:hypothetical protein